MSLDAILQAFDEQFGTDGPEKDSDSIGHGAGCDDCAINIRERAAHRAFIERHFTDSGQKMAPSHGRETPNILNNG